MGDKISSGNTLRLQMMCQIADSFLTGGIHLGAVVGAGVALEAGDGVPQQQQEPQQHGWVTGVSAVCDRDTLAVAHIG